MRSLFLLMMLLLGGCASQHRATPNQKLYFALELRREGRLVGQPKLVGETGQKIRVEKRDPGATEAAYQLALLPSDDGPDSFQLDLDVSLPGARGHSRFDLLHGEERKVQLGSRPGDLEVKLLVMKVDSTEFRALMDLSEFGAGSAPGSI